MSERAHRFRRGLAAFNATGKIDPGFLADDFELQQSSSIIDSRGAFRGRDALQASHAELTGSFEDLTFEATDVLEAPGGEMVVLIHARGRGRGSGVVIDNRIAWVLTFRGDQAVRMVIYEEPEEALAALGLQSSA